MTPNPYEVNFKRRSQRLLRRLRMCETPGNRVESAVQKITAEILKEYDWSSQTPFPIPLDDQTDEASNEMRRAIQSEQLEIQGIVRAQLPQYPAFFFEGCFTQPTYHWGLLHGLAKVFEFGEIPAVSWASLHLKDSDSQNTKLVELVWLADFAQVPSDSVMQLVLQYRDSLIIGQQNRGHRNANVKNITNSSHVNPINAPHMQNNHEYHFITSNNTNPNSSNRSSNTEMDSRTISSVIQTISNNKFSGALEQSVDMLFVMFNMACQKFRVPECEKNGPTDVCIRGGR